MIIEKINKFLSKLFNSKDDQVKYLSGVKKKPQTAESTLP